MSNYVGSRTVFSGPFEAPLFEPTGLRVESSDSEPRAFMFGNAISALDPDILATLTPERAAEIGNAYPLSTEG